MQFPILHSDEPHERVLKSPRPEALSGRIRWLLPLLGVIIIIIGWIMFGLGVGWGVHGSVIAGTVGE